MKLMLSCQQLVTCRICRVIAVNAWVRSAFGKSFINLAVCHLSRYLSILRLGSDVHPGDDPDRLLWNGTEHNLSHFSFFYFKSNSHASSLPRSLSAFLYREEGRQEEEGEEGHWKAFLEDRATSLGDWRTSIEPQGPSWPPSLFWRPPLGQIASSGPFKS